MEVEMKIRGLMMDPVTNMPIVILKDANGGQILPIWGGKSWGATWKMLFDALIYGLVTGGTFGWLWA